MIFVMDSYKNYPPLHSIIIKLFVFDNKQKISLTVVVVGFFLSRTKNIGFKNNKQMGLIDSLQRFGSF